MAVTLAELATMSFRTTRDADRQCEELLKRLGYKVNYLAARLAIARSLGLVDPPNQSTDAEDDPGRTIRGQQLFGESADAAAWLALIVQRSGTAQIERKELQRLVAAHWRRGAELLTQDWQDAGGSLTRFVEGLADRAALPENANLADGGAEGSSDDAPLEAGEILLPLGEIGEDADSGDPVTFPLNAPGGSPHMGIMGGAGSGKTRTAAFMVKRLRAEVAIPLLAFDFKGDLADSYQLDQHFGANVVAPPRQPLPLDVLSVAAADEFDLRETASRVAESIARIKTSKITAIQSTALNDAIYSCLKKEGTSTLKDVSDALNVEYRKLDRGPDELSATLAQLTRFVLFEPKLSHSEFFRRSWVVSLPPDTSAEVRKLVINLCLDALDRWINSLPDAPVIDGRRALRHLTFLDEAHVILNTGLPALNNLVRMSRSKGGVVALISQSPNDFEGQDDSFLDNVGLTLSFNTNAKAGPVNRIFGRGSALSDLETGVALCRIRTEARTRRVRCWSS